MSSAVAFQIGNKEKPVLFDELVPSPWSVSTGKRVFDITVSLAVLAVFSLPMVLIGLLIRLSTGNSALFIQKRVGAGGNEFDLCKFRTMISAEQGPGLTRKGDARVTRAGRILREFKLDELPQFFNVLCGDMSLVGPRPKLRMYAESLNLPYRPGITGAATLGFSHEEELLQRFSDTADMEAFYLTHVMSVKARLDGTYMSVCTFGSDLRLLADTVLACLRIRRPDAEICAQRLAAVARWETGDGRQPDYSSPHFPKIPITASRGQEALSRVSK